MNRISLIFLFVFLFSINWSDVSGHGYLLDPPGRASAWRKGFRTPKNYDDMGQICKGKCTPCGMPANDAGGQYATNTIVGRYSPGQIITAVVKLTANHNGPHYFSLCPNPNQVSDACFERNPIEVIGPNKISYEKSGSGDHTIQLKLPNIQCHHCVFRWHWDARNTGEKYRNCADISIGGKQIQKPDPEVPEGPAPAPATARPKTGKTPKNGKCRKVASNVSDSWCNDNCKRGFCPSQFCKCH